MNSPTDPRIDTYIEKSAAFAQPILRRLRALVHRACPDATETMKWSHPHFLQGDAILCSMAAFKAHCAFGFWHQGMVEILAAEGVSGKDAMGSMGRITGPKDLPADAVLLRWVRAAAKLNASDAPARPRPKRGPVKETPVPVDLATALKKNAAAAKAFAGFPPSHRKEYVEWIIEAKRAETRQTRLATTNVWLAEGKARNWKYENC